jgi:hypothetical protein
MIFENKSIMVTPHFLHDFLLKSILAFEKRTKKMSKNEKPKYFCANSHAHTINSRFPSCFCLIYYL